jgi:hypothetical protein
MVASIPLYSSIYSTFIPLVLRGSELFWTLDSLYLSSTVACLLVRPCGVSFERLRQDLIAYTIRRFL